MNKVQFQAIKDKVQDTEIFQLLKHARNYFSAEIATKAIGILSLPILTRLFSPEDFGTVALFMSYLGIFTVIISMNSHASVGRYYFEETDDFPEFVGTTLTLVTAIIVVLAPFYFLFYRNLSDFTGLPGMLPTFLFFVCIFEVLHVVYNQILIPQKRSKEAATIKVLRGYLSFGLTLLLVLLLDDAKYRGQIWAVFIVGFIFFVYFIIQILRSSKLTFRKKHFKYIAQYSFPLIPYALSGVILHQFDRIMIDHSEGTGDTGLYSLGHNIGALVFLLNHAVNVAFTPYFFEMMANKEFRKLDKTTGRLFSLVALGGLVLIFFAYELGELLAAETFHEGLKVIPPIVAGYMFFSVFMFYGRFIGYEKKTFYSSVLIITAGVVNIVMNATLIPRYGYIAAAYTTLVSYLLLACLTWLVTRFLLVSRQTPLSVIVKPLFFMTVCLGIYYLASTAGLSFWLMELTKIILVLAFASAIFLKDVLVSGKGLSDKNPRK